jgi:hypothetical protein
MSNEQLEYYVQLLSENIDALDSLPDELVDQIIIYLQSEIERKEKLLNEIESNN